MAREERGWPSRCAAPFELAAMSGVLALLPARQAIDGGYSAL